MIIEFDGVEYDYSPEYIDMRTAIAIRDHTGKGMLSWTRGVDDADPTCLQALFWAMKVQHGERVSIKNLDFSPVEFYNCLRKATEADLSAKVAAEAERAMGGEGADPTVTAES